MIHYYHGLHHIVHLVGYSLLASSNTCIPELNEVFKRACELVGVDDIYIVLYRCIPLYCRVGIQCIGATHTSLECRMLLHGGGDLVEYLCTLTAILVCIKIRFIEWSCRYHIIPLTLKILHSEGDIVDIIIDAVCIVPKFTSFILVEYSFSHIHIT